MHRATPRDRNAAIVLAAVKGSALARRPDGRPGPPLRAMAAKILAGTEEWTAFWPNKGMTKGLTSCGTVTPPHWSK